MQVQRRAFLIRSAAGAAASALAAGLPGVALALNEGEARAHVEQTIDEVLALVREPGDSNAKAPALQGLMERRAAMPQIARFSAGIAWRNMNQGQQDRFVAAFGHYLAVAYARRFAEYDANARNGKPYTIEGVVDAGKKGMLVKTSILRSGGGVPFAVEWLVTDQPGRVVVADIVIEGVSLLVTQREEIAGMLESRGGDVERLITDLGAG